MRKLYHLVPVIILLLVVGLAACGGGGGDEVGQKEEEPASTMVIEGMASKGPIDAGNVSVCQLEEDGTKGKLLGSAVTTPDGSYSVDIGSSSGSILVEVTGGKYVDEATGTTVSLGSQTLRAVLPSAREGSSITVTPLTELAVLLAGSLTKENIDSANTKISSVIGFDITGTKPRDVCSAENCSDAAQAEIDYGLVLASISQMIKDRDTPDVFDLINRMKADLEDGKMETTGAQLGAALQKFMANAARNKSGVNDPAETPLDDALKAGAWSEASGSQDSDLDKAKGMARNVRKMISSVCGDERVIPQILFEPSYKRFSEELEILVDPEIVELLDRIEWIVSSAINISKGMETPLTRNAYTLTISLPPEGARADFAIRQGDNLLDSGSLSLLKVQNSISGDLALKMNTAGGNLDAHLKYSCNSRNDYYRKVALTGSMISPGLSLDCTEEGKKIEIAISYAPGKSRSYLGSINVNGRILTNSATMEGRLRMTNAWSASLSAAVCDSATFSGSFQKVMNGMPDKTRFEGTIIGQLNDIRNYGVLQNETEQDFAKWTASFEGELEESSGPPIHMFLRAKRAGFKKLLLDMDCYELSRNGKAASLLRGNAVFEDNEGRYLTASFQDSDKTVLELAYYPDKPQDTCITGYMEIKKESGDKTMGQVCSQNGTPTVKFIDDSLESIM